MAAPKRSDSWIPHFVLIMGVIIFVFPIYFAVIGSTHDAATIATGRMPLLPGGHMLDNYWQALTSGSGFRVSATPVRILLINSLIMALVITVGKIAISIISAYAVVFFNFPFRMFFFWTIFVTLMLPVEVRIIPTYKVVTDLHMVNTFSGLTIPLIASATATLLFRQVFLTIPDELAEAAKIDGAGPMRFFWQIVLPLSKTNIAALFVILFIYGWNQYLWPLLITTNRSMETIVIGIVKMIGTSDAQTDWNLIMATAILAMLPPVAVVVFMQHWFVKGLVETEK
jgi:sn-glycerol 3-phosphate transport system permease protein